MGQVCIQCSNPLFFIPISNCPHLDLPLMSIVMFSLVSNDSNTCFVVIRQSGRQCLVLFLICIFAKWRAISNKGIDHNLGHLWNKWQTYRDFNMFVQMTRCFSGVQAKVCESNEHDMKTRNSISVSMVRSLLYIEKVQSWLLDIKAVMVRHVVITDSHQHFGPSVLVPLLLNS
jgi:hypothetical protein